MQRITRGPNMHTTFIGRAWARVDIWHILLVVALLSSLQTTRQQGSPSPQNPMRIGRPIWKSPPGDSQEQEQQQEQQEQQQQEREQRPDVASLQEQRRYREAPASFNGRQCARSRGLGLGPVPTRADPFAISAVHIPMILDKAYFGGCMAATFSILKHTTCPPSVVFHFLVSSRKDPHQHQHQQLLQYLVRSTFRNLRLQLHQLDEELVKAQISHCFRSELEQPLNFTRIYLPQLLDLCIERVIYLDSDLVVVDDIAGLWNTSLGIHTVGSPKYCNANFTKYFTPAFWDDHNLASIWASAHATSTQGSW